MLGKKCENCGSKSPDPRWVKSNGKWYCSNGCVHNKETLEKHRGSSGVMSGLGQMADGAFGGSGMSADNIVGGAGKVALGLAKGLFRKKPLTEKQLQRKKEKEEERAQKKAEEKALRDEVMNEIKSEFNKEMKNELKEAGCDELINDFKDIGNSFKGTGDVLKNTAGAASLDKTGEMLKDSMNPLKMFKK